MSLYDPSQLLALLRRAGAELTVGLSAEEFQGIEARYGIEFGPDHRELFSLALPIGSHWVDWRHDDEASILRRLDWPIEGVLFDVENNAFWARSWGGRPNGLADALELAERNLQDVPRLIPIYSHRYLPAGPCEPGLPVFSVYQTDTVYYGVDLPDYLEREFSWLPPEPVDRQPKYVPFWSELAEGREDDL